MEAVWPDVLFTDDFRAKARQSRLLLVGAGGIGCEVLKTLVLTGFRRITLVDLDSIEISNLNRQFLFRDVHVGQSKAVTAGRTVSTFIPKNPSSPKPTEPNRALCITPHHASIEDPKFDVDFYKGFDVVLNGLDNLGARRHVNRLCFAANVPLVESGTAGYEGSVTVHVRGQTHCYECEEKPVQKSFPICTIRNTPERMIHCVVWAKDLLFPRLFGRQDVKTDLDEESTADEGASPQSRSFFLRGGKEAVGSYARRIFRRVFRDDIVSVRQMEDLWKSKKPPSPLDLPPKGVDGSSSVDSPPDPYRVLGQDESVRLFLESIASIYCAHGDDIGSLAFDKDDDLAVQFVTAASNLRAACYSIPPSSVFDIKGMAGNIVHAVATTNAIVAGLVVTEACKIVSGCHPALKETFIGKHGLVGPSKRKRDILIKSTNPPKQNPSCVTCSVAIVQIEVDAETMSLGHLVQKVIKSRLCVLEPSLVCGGFMYEEGEGLEDDEREEYEAFLPQKLSSLPGGGLKHGAILEVCSQAQHFSCRIVLSHKDDIDPELHPDGFIIQGAVPEVESKRRSQEEVGKRKRADPLSDGRLVEQNSQGLDLMVISDDGSGDETAPEFVAKKIREKGPDD